MINTEEISRKLKVIESIVTNYINENMNSHFLLNMQNEQGVKAEFTTASGTQVIFGSSLTSLINETGLHTYICIDGKINGLSFRFSFNTNKEDRGYGCIESGKYGIRFSNVANDEIESEITPYIISFDRSRYKFVSKTYKKLLPIIEQLSEDIKTITPDEETKKYLKPKENISEFAEPTSSSAPYITTQNNNAVSDRGIQKAQLSALRNEVERMYLEAGYTVTSLPNEDKTEEQSFGLKK